MHQSIKEAGRGEKTRGAKTLQPAHAPNTDKYGAFRDVWGKLSGGREGKKGLTSENFQML